MDESLPELKIEIYGRVQGVAFRDVVTRYAQSLSLTGYVKNNEDGSVVIIAQGEPHRLDEFLSWVQKGYIPMKIRAMRYEWSTASTVYTGFSIKREGSFIKDQLKGVKNLGTELFRLKKPEKIPQHVVIIADGNRRWARQRGWHPWIGHRKAIEYSRIKAIFDEAKKIGIKYFSVWFFSTENWDRDPKEIEVLFGLFRIMIVKWREQFLQEEIRFRHFGRKDRLPADIIETMEKLEKETEKFTKFNIQLCLDYGGKDDLVRAFRKMLEAGVKDIEEATISQYLDTHEIPDPDLIIRTSGEQRTSGIMVYQAAYAELYFTNVCFPDFDANELYRAVLDYSGRVRRFGGTALEDTKNIDVSKLIDPDQDIDQLVA